MTTASSLDEVVLYESAALAGGAKSTVKGRAEINVPGSAVIITVDGRKYAYPMHRIHEIRWGTR